MFFVRPPVRPSETWAGEVHVCTYAGACATTLAPIRHCLRVFVHSLGRPLDDRRQRVFVWTAGTLVTRCPGVLAHDGLLKCCVRQSRRAARFAASICLRVSSRISTTGAAFLCRDLTTVSNGATLLSVLFRLRLLSVFFRLRLGFWGVGVFGFGGKCCLGGHAKLACACNRPPACPSSGAIIAVWFCWFGSVVRFHRFVFGGTVARSFSPGLGGAFPAAVTWWCVDLCFVCCKTTCSGLRWRRRPLQSTRRWPRLSG